MAQGSLEEARYYLILGCDLGFIETDSNLPDDVDRVARMLHALVAAVAPS